MHREAHFGEVCINGRPQNNRSVVIRLGDADQSLIGCLEQLVICGWITTLERWILFDLIQPLQFVGEGCVAL